MNFQGFFGAFEVGDKAYKLCFPNLEVKGSFEVYLAGECSDLMADQVKDSVYKLADRFSGSESTSIPKADTARNRKE